MTLVLLASKACILKSTCVRQKANKQNQFIVQIFPNTCVVPSTSSSSGPTDSISLGSTTSLCSYNCPYSSFHDFRPSSVSPPRFTLHISYQPSLGNARWRLSCPFLKFLQQQHQLKGITWVISEHSHGLHPLPNSCFQLCFLPLSSLSLSLSSQ